VKANDQRQKKTMASGVFVFAQCANMLVKLIPGVNFINVPRAAFMRADPKSSK